MKPSGGQSWLEQRVSGVVSGVRGSELFAYEGRVDPMALGRRIGTWLEGRGYQTEVIAAERMCIVKAAPAGWEKKWIVASPCLKAEVNTVAAGIKVDVFMGQVRGGVWTARHITYSRVAFGVEFVTLKGDLLHFVRQELQAHGGMMQAHPQILDVVETVRFEQSLGTTSARSITPRATRP